MRRLNLVLLAAAGLLGLSACERPAELQSAPERRPAAARVPEAERPQSAETARLEAEVIRRVNAARREHGLAPLENNETLSAVARAHSRAMAASGVFEHELPRGPRFAQRIEAAGLRYSRIGENIYKSVGLRDPAPNAVASWLKSPGHRSNILNGQYTESGIGIWKTGDTYYFTQDFLRPAEVRPRRPLP
jgi:uncharacterized protein YkwD